MSPIVRKPPAKKPALKKTVKPVLKKRVGTAAKKPIRVVKKATGVKRPAKIMRIGSPARPAAKAARPVVKPAVRVTKEGLAAQLKQFKALRSGLEGKTNQDMINVIYKAADELKMPAWTLLATAKLDKLVDARTAPYSGPAVSDLPGLTPDQKSVIQKVLSAYTRPG